jgi:hypothetical protein
MQDGQVLARGSEWVKVIDDNGQIRSVDWHDKYGQIFRMGCDEF